MKDLQELCKEYPELYTDVYFECDNGWYGILSGLAMAFRDILKDNLEGEVEVYQVKEKFGELRFYYQLHNVTDDEAGLINAIVRLAEVSSGQTCELCGDYGKSCHKNGWCKTLCETHIKEHGYATGN